MRRKFIAICRQMSGFSYNSDAFFRVRIVFHAALFHVCCRCVASFMLACCILHAAMFQDDPFCTLHYFTTIDTIGTVGKHNRIPRNLFSIRDIYEFQNKFLRNRCDLPATMLRCCFCYGSVLDSIDFLCVCVCVCVCNALFSPQ